MRKPGSIVFALFACALAVGWLLGTPSIAAVNGPTESAWNTERVGIGYNGDTIDLGPYSKMAPWPETDGHYLYSPCYDPAPLVASVPGADRCFMTISLKDPDKPVRLATVYAYDLDASPSPPDKTSSFWGTYPHGNVWTATYFNYLNKPENIKAPCGDWKPGSPVLAGTAEPTCWDPGWNTHTHYSAYHSKILAVNQERYRGGTNVRANYHGVKFYDISDRAHPKFLSYWAAPVSDPDPTSGVWPDSAGTHHFNFDPDGDYLYLGTEYKGFVTTTKILVILDVRNPRHPKEAGKWWITGQGNEEYPTANWLQQPSFSSPITVDSTTKKYKKHVGMHYATVYGDIAYLSYHQAGLVILDVKHKHNPKLLSRLDYMVPEFETLYPEQAPNPDKAFCVAAANGAPAACGNSHAARLVPGRHGHLLWMADEYFSCPYGHVRMIDVSDKTNPRIISHYLTDQNTNCNGAATADTARFPRRGPSSHLGNAWNSDLLFMAWYGMGLQVINIADPYHPMPAGWYEYRIDKDLPSGFVYPPNQTSANYAGSDTYDVLFGPKDYLYLSDGTAGLRVLKYTGPGFYHKGEPCKKFWDEPWENHHGEED
jgi:hypothetical protein